MGARLSGGHLGGSLGRKEVGRWLGTGAGPVSDWEMNRKKDSLFFTGVNVVFVYGLIQPSTGGVVLPLWDGFDYGCVRA